MGTNVCTTIKAVLGAVEESYDDWLIGPFKWKKRPGEFISGRCYSDLPECVQKYVKYACWALTCTDSLFFIGRLQSQEVFEAAPDMAKERKVWESVLAVKVIDEFDCRNLFRLFHRFAPRYLLAERDFVKRACQQNLRFGHNLVDLLEDPLRTDIDFLMELVHQNEGRLGCASFRRNCQSAAIIVAWRRMIQWCEAHPDIGKHFDHHLWSSIGEYIAFPKRVYLSRQSSNNFSKGEGSGSGSIVQFPIAIKMHSPKTKYAAKVMVSETTVLTVNECGHYMNINI